MGSAQLQRGSQEGREPGQGKGRAGRQLNLRVVRIWVRGRPAMCI